jgi:hypothetical protein
MEEQPAELLVESVNPTHEFIRDAPSRQKAKKTVWIEFILWKEWPVLLF